ncbi:MAG: hypothetical protein HY445_00105 [Candidatus Niyogibacteria bacterium]|nr:hypothetical protein [Candidatus Niyogibacteria bacterium]
MIELIKELFSLFNAGPTAEILRIVGIAWFIWLPIVLILIFWDVWIIYVRSGWVVHSPWILLELKLPREIAKSPRAMEVVLNSFHNTRKGNLYERYWQGFLAMWYSLEIVGINGEVHFFIYTTSFFRNLVESQFYSQYPDMEIIEVDDYTKAVPKDIPNEEWRMWGAEYKLTKPDVYPIRTYVEFRLDDQAKEEEKADPLVSLMEFLGSLRPGEQVWVQLLIKGADSGWQKEAAALIDKLVGRKKFAPPSEEGRLLFPSPGETDVLKALERNIAKIGYKTGIRFIYLGRRDVYTWATFAAFLGIMKQFNSATLNGLTPAWSTSVDYFFPNWRSVRRQKRLIDMYRQRSYFFPPYGSFLWPDSGRVRPFILTTEELATLFHFPGRTAETPTLERIESRKGEPPPNLPV